MPIFAPDMEIIAHIHSDFGTKFGVPRQSGVATHAMARIVFTPPYRNAEALRGLDGFTHIWLLWDFSQAHRPDGQWSPTVRPPRLGGNVRMGVWATRSPFRPNNIGLSSVRLEGIELDTPDGPVLTVSGADLMDGTPILDIKPYLPYTDCHPDATGGFTDELERHCPTLQVEIPDDVAARFTAQQLQALRQVLEADPRPRYQQDATRTYGMEFAGVDVRFRIDGQRCKVLSKE